MSTICHVGFPGGSVVKNPPANVGDRNGKKEMATHSSIPAWEIPWTEEPDGLQSMGCNRVGHDLVTKQQQQISHVLCQTLGTHQ